MAQRNFEQVENLFARCLLRVLDLDLWRTYLKYQKVVSCYLHIDSTNLTFGVNNIVRMFIDCSQWNKE
jgi:hypothetical protein